MLYGSNEDNSSYKAGDSIGMFNTTRPLNEFNMTDKITISDEAKVVQNIIFLMSKCFSSSRTSNSSF